MRIFNILIRKRSNPQVDENQRRAGANILKFMAALLAFTLIARGTSGVTLARVELTTPQRSEIVDAISGSATVASREFADIVAPEGLIVKEVHVTVGGWVEAGAVLAEFDMEEVTEKHIRETISLERMRVDLERAQRGESVDRSAVDNARVSLERAQRDYAATVAQGNAEIAEAQEALDALLLPAGEVASYLLPLVIHNYRRAQEDFDIARAQTHSEIGDATQVLMDLWSAAAEGEEIDDTALQNAMRHYQREREDYEAVIAQGEREIAEAERAAEDARRRPDVDRSALDSATRNHRRAREDLEAAKGNPNISAILSAWQRIVEAEFMLNQITEIIHLHPDIDHSVALDTAIHNHRRALEEYMALTQGSQNPDIILSAERRLEDAAAALEQAQRNYDDSVRSVREQAEAALESAIKRAEDNARSAGRRLEDAEIALAQAQRNFQNSLDAADEQLQSDIERASEGIDAALNRAEDTIRNALRRVDDARDSVMQEIQRAETAVDTATTRAADNAHLAARRVEDAEIAVRTALENYSRSIQQQADTAVQNALNAQILELDIVRQEILIASLEALISKDGILCSEVEGIVYSTMAAGATTSHSPVAVLRDMTSGFEATLQIAQEEAERLRPGDEVTVEAPGGNIYFTPTVTGAITAMTAPDENNKVVVTISLPGSNWSIGQRVNVEIILSRATYDMSVPLSALRTDNSGYFLLVMEQRSSVLGLHNTAVRVNVNIVASDNTMVSVSGAVGRNSAVIVGSNKAVAAGDRVRVAA